MFRVFDEDKSGELNFFEFMQVFFSPPSKIDIVHCLLPALNQFWHAKTIFYKIKEVTKLYHTHNQENYKYDLQANNVTNLYTPEDKLNWIFTAFDTDGGGTIDVEEIRCSFNIFL